MTIKSLERRVEALKLRETGLTYAEIGRRWGISVERVRQIVKGNPKRKKDKPDFEGLLTTTEAARLLHIHANTARRWNDKGILKSYRIGSRGDRRFLKEDINNFLKGYSER